MLTDLVRRVNPDTASPLTSALGKPIPVVSRHANPVARDQVQFVGAGTRSVFDKCHLNMAVLTTKVVDVVQRLEVARCVCMHRLHQLICHPTNLHHQPTSYATIHTYIIISSSASLLLHTIIDK